MFQKQGGLTISGKDIKIGLKGGGKTDKEFSGTTHTLTEQQTSTEEGEQGNF